MKRVTKGFTLIELMIVVAIIGILAAIAIPNFLRFQLRARFGELKENVGSVFKSEEALRQSERTAGTTSGYYLALGYLPLACSATVPSPGKYSWTATDYQTARLIDWQVEGKTYGCYHIGTNAAWAINTTGIHLTAYAESNIDGDDVNACVYLFKPTLNSTGEPTTGGTSAGFTDACTRSGGRAFPTNNSTANAIPGFGGWGVPSVLSDNVF